LNSYFVAYWIIHYATNFATNSSFQAICGFLILANLKDKAGRYGTEAFLNLLIDNKHKIRLVDLPGSLTIDKAFEDIIKKGKSFGRSQFYSAKQDDNCQWYGIINGFDVIWRDYPKIKEEVLQAFSTISISKVVAVVYGTGGCGKSTLLRRLALEIYKEADFETIWVEDNQLESFVSEALPNIQADIENKYLVFVEDWYRLVGMNTELGDDLLKTTQSISNIRLVIGDRDIKGKNYIFNLMNRKNIFELAEIENQDILEKIISKHTDWQDAFNLLTKQNKKIYNSPLFIILFAIAGVQEKRIDINDRAFTDLENTVRRIAKHDLKKITKHYPGFAKALHYWACVYAKYKIFISYNTFLEVADFYNKDKEISSDFKNWKTDSKVLNILKLYINVSKNENLAERFHDIDFVQFNHDKLAESVLVEVEFENWEPYIDQKRKLLKVIIENGDDYSASIFLRTFLDSETQIFEDNQEKKSFIDKLFYERKNWDFKYLTALRRFNLNSSELYEYIEILAKQELYHPILWLEYFKIGTIVEKQSAAHEILTHNDLLTLRYEIVVAAFRQSGNEVEKQEVVHKILTYDDLLTLPHHFNIAFRQSGNDKEKQAAAHKILTHDNLVTLPCDIVGAAFHQSGNDKKKEAAAHKILIYGDLLILPHHFVNIAFQQSGNEAEKKAVAKKILDHTDLLTIQPQIIVVAFQQSGNTEAKEKAAKKILTNSELLTLQHHFVNIAFHQSGNDEEKEAAAHKILTNGELLTLPHHFVNIAFHQSGNDEEKEAAAYKILTYEELLTLQHHFVNIAFHQSGNEAEKKAVAKRILDHTDLLTIQPEIIFVAFQQSGNEDEKEKAAYMILTHNDLLTFQPEIVVASFKQSGNEVAKQSAAKKILIHSDLLTFQPEIVVASFQQSGNEVAKQSAAKKILQNPSWNDNKNLFPVLAALNFYSTVDKIPDFVNERIKNIINAYLGNRKPKLNKDLYFGLMYIPFHSNRLWKTKSKYIIDNWDRIERRGIVNVLKSYIAYPESVRVVCKAILENWRIEIGQKIYKVYGKPNQGDHIRMSLGHPDLRSFAKDTAEDIVKARNNESVDVPDYLFVIAEKIVNENIYPEWNPTNEDESNNE